VDNDTTGGNFITDAGAVYIFKRSGSTWTQQQRLNALHRNVYGYFGVKLSLNENLQLVGRYDSKDVFGGDSLNNAGGAYLYRLSNGVFQLVAKIVPSDRAAYEYFSSAVAINGNNLLVGARGEREDVSGGNTLSDAGAAYFYSMPDKAYYSEMV